MINSVESSVKPKFETLVSKTRSEHYINTYAVHDRCDFSQLSDDPPNVDPTSLDASTLLPSVGDQTQLLRNFSTSASQIICVEFVS